MTRRVVLRLFDAGNELATMVDEVLWLDDDVERAEQALQTAKEKWDALAMELGLWGECEGCGEQFTRADRRQRFCTPQCASRVRQRRFVQRRGEAPSEV